jgi:hypothetical protein
MNVDWLKPLLGLLHFLSDKVRPPLASCPGGADGEAME